MNIQKFGGQGIEKGSVYRTVTNVEQSKATQKSVKTAKKINIKEDSSNKDSTAYEEWIALKQEQEKSSCAKSRPASAVTGKKVRY